MFTCSWIEGRKQWFYNSSQMCKLSNVFYFYLLQKLRNQSSCKCWQFCRLFRKPSGFRWLFSNNAKVKSVFILNLRSSWIKVRDYTCNSIGTYIGWEISYVAQNKSKRNPGADVLRAYRNQAREEELKCRCSLSSGKTSWIVWVQVQDCEWKHNKIWTWNKSVLISDLALG